ncbi:MAG: hypothetical protein ACYSWP_12900 [Planctomycetota bacterium]
MAYNERLTDAPELTMTKKDEFTIGRHHLEHLTDWITDRIIVGSITNAPIDGGLKKDEKLKQ